MTEEELQTLNKEQKEQDYLGKTALQVYAEVLRLNPTIQRVQFRQYRYTYPQAPDGRGIHEDTSFWIEREDFLKGSKIFQDSLANLSDGFNLALESELELENGERAYLPMMDTSIPKSTENLERLKKNNCDFFDTELWENGYIRNRCFLSYNGVCSYVTS